MGSTKHLILILFFALIPFADLADERVILQTPTQPVFEGDALTLKCRDRYNYHITRVVFYKDKELQSQAGTELSVARVSKSDEGSYKCTAWGWSSYLGDSAEVRVSVRERPQAVLTLEPAWTQIFKSERVTLRCQVPGDYTDWRFTWYKAGRNAPVTQYSYSSTDGDSYTISSATKDHSGEYTCQGERTGNPSYSKTSDALTLRVSDERVILQTPTQPVFEGDALTLKCRDRYNYHITRVVFYKDKELQSQAGTELSVARVSKSDEGSYKCTAWGWSSYLGDSAEVRVSVRERPQAVLTLEPAQIFKSESVTLRCEVQGDYTDWRFTWYKDGSKVSATQDYYSRIDGDKYTISFATKGHSGEYTCKGERKGNPSYSKTSDALTLRVSDERVILQTPTQPVFEGDALTLRCRVRYNYHITRVVFYKDNKELQSQADTELSVHRVSKSDEGSYKCTAWWRSSPYYGDSAEVRVSVRERFSTPTLTVLPGASVWEGEAVTLQCGAQIYKQGTRLQYRYSKDNGDLIGARSREPYSIPAAELRDTGSYQCEVEAEGTGLKKRSYSVSLTVKEIPKAVLVREPAGVPISESDTVTLRCQVPGELTAWGYTWYKDGRSLPLYQNWNDRYTIGSAAVNHSGEYTCQGDRTGYPSHSKRSDALTLTVLRLKLSGVALRVSPIGGVVIEGTSLSLLCSVAVGSLPIVFTWHREGSQGHIARHTAVDQRSDELILLRAQESDTGSYCCQAAYGEGEEGISSQSALLTVLVPVSAPSLSLVSGNSVAPSGDTLTLRCESHRGTGPIWYSFHHRGNEGNQSSTLLYWTSLPGPGPVSHNRTILNESDSGQYWCDSFNNVSQEIKTSERINITAIVPVAGANLSSALPEGGVWKNSRVSLHCSVLRGTKPSYSWYRNGQRLHIPDHIRTYTLSEGGATLSIHSVQELHEGTYQCVAENQITERRTFNSTSNTVELRTATALTLIVSLVSVFILLPVISACLFLTVRALKNNQSLRETIEKYGVIRQKPKTLREPAASPVAENSHDIPETSHAAEREGELVYAVVDIKKKSKVKRGQEPKNRKNPPLEYCVTYAKVNDRASEKTEGEKEECVYSLQHEAGIEGTREEGKGKREEGRGNEGAREGRTEGLIYTLPIITRIDGVREGGKGKSGREECFYSLPREVGRGREGCMYFEPRQTERGGGGEREEEVYSLPRGVGMYSLPREVERENGRVKGPGEGVYSNEESLYENFQQRT
ncbi:Fc receptor-like protein 5 isoform X2 [Acipenser ruthenus]|uniref:Fc receptor-like protein 5 isoform X2 n=1 Tax=Acipenser ruthenus TaxID=7906 RepID=UPI002741B04C|nr:Fc receptor-like protein 5 isoform X2 [Acipenser ruthenus]